MEYRLELDPDCARFPLLWGCKFAPIPRQAAIFLRALHHLPGVRNNDRRPGAIGQFGLMRVIGGRAAIRIRPESPLTGEAELLAQPGSLRGRFGCGWRRCGRRKRAGDRKPYRTGQKTTSRLHWTSHSKNEAGLSILWRITGQKFLELVVGRFLPESAFGPVSQAPAAVLVGRRWIMLVVELVV